MMRLCNLYFNIYFILNDNKMIFSITYIYVYHSIVNTDVEMIEKKKI